MKLIGMEGGRGDGADRTTTAERALELYAEARASRPRADEAPWETTLFVEVLGSFVEEIVGGRDGGFEFDDLEQPTTLQRLSAAALVRCVGPCVRLFPYQALVGAAVSTALPGQASHFVSWLGHSRLVDERDVRAAERDIARAMPDVRRHAALQARLDELLLPLHTVAETPRVLGRFLVVSVDPGALRVAVPAEGHRYKVVLPGELPVAFERGQAVSMVLQRAALGWLPISSALPERPETIDSLAAEARRPSWPRPVDGE